MKNIKEKIKKGWNWLWNSESVLSYIILLVLMILIIKYILIQGLALLFGTALPLAIVESSSMDHHSLPVCISQEQSTISILTFSYPLTHCTKYIEQPTNEICGQIINDSKFFNLDDYWNSCGRWYEQNANITKEEFDNFKFKNGFRKGDIIISFGKKNIAIGDVIIFQAKYGNSIIHRVVKLDPIQTKGDHNSMQLDSKNNNRVDETLIAESRVVGTAVAKIPYLGYIKIWFLTVLFWASKNILLTILILIILLIIYFISKTRKI